MFYFQRDVTSAYWQPKDSLDYGSSNAVDILRPELEALVSQGQYIGHQLVSTQFRSFDLQSETKAVVTVRETWQDARYAGEYPDIGAEPLAQRGPYTLDVTYTIEFAPENSSWQVTQAVFANQPPAW